MLVLPLFTNLIRALGNCRKNDPLVVFLATLNGNNRNSWTLSDTFSHLNISFTCQSETAGVASGQREQHRKRHRTPACLFANQSIGSLAANRYVEDRPIHPS